VFFNAASNGGGGTVVTIATGNTGARSINCTGFTRRIDGDADITVAGGVTLVAAMTYTHTGTMTLTGTGTLTTAGKVFPSVTINGSGITVTLGDALTTGNGVLTITQGTFNTANFSVAVSAILASNPNPRSVILGNSNVTVGGNFELGTSGSLTFNAGTSQINLFGTSSLEGGSRTFHNVSFTSASAGVRIISGANTFNNLSLTASATALSQLVLEANQTVNGTFTCGGSSATRRGFVRSNILGTTRTITAAAVSAAADCDFRDITIAGAAAPISPTRAGDCGGNSGITFPAAKTVFWNLAGAQNWNSTGWATSSNGTPAVNNFPLAQDTATFTNDGAAGTVAFTQSYNVRTLDLSGRTSAMTLNHNASFNIYGNYTLGSGATVSGGSTQTFAGRDTQTFTSAGKTITFGLTVDKPSGAFELGDAYSASNAISHTRGTFDAKNYNVTCAIFSSSGNNSRMITMGSGLWTLSGTGTLWSTSTTGLTFNKDTADILLSNTSTSARAFSGGVLTYNKLTIGGATGTSTTSFVGASTFSELASTKTVAHTITITSTASGTTIGTWSITGTAGNVVTVNSSIAGTQRNFNLTNATTSNIDYLAVRDIAVNQANRFYVGANSTNNGNNSNVIFTASPFVAASGNFFMLFS
jgi:hypothetical protein